MTLWTQSQTPPRHKPDPFGTQRGQTRHCGPNLGSLSSKPDPWHKLDPFGSQSGQTPLGATFYVTLCIQPWPTKLKARSLPGTSPTPCGIQPGQTPLGAVFQLTLWIQPWPTKLADRSLPGTSPNPFWDPTRSNTTRCNILLDTMDSTLVH